MPNTPQARQNLRITKKNTIRNVSWNSRLKSMTKKLQQAAAKKESLPAVLAEAFQLFDKAASKGIIKRNTASRKKSRMALFVAKATKA